VPEQARQGWQKQGDETSRSPVRSGLIGKEKIQD
jgi:hypothetical protein